MVFCILAAPHHCFIPLPPRWRVWNKCRKRKEKKKQRRKDVSCFTAFSAPLELNYEGTVICSLSARRWQIPVAQFERCVVKHYSFALELQTLYGMPCTNHRFPQSCVGSLGFSPVVSVTVCSRIQLPASPCTLQFDSPASKTAHKYFHLHQINKLTPASFLLLYSSKPHAGLSDWHHKLTNFWSLSQDYSQGRWRIAP